MSGGVARADLLYVVDASAVLALVLGEVGSDWLESRFERSGLSVVNLEEVLGRLTEQGANVGKEHDDILRLGVTILPYGTSEAVASAALRPRVADRGLSLGDRACLVTARAHRVPAVTADGIWTVRPDGRVPKRAKLDGITVIQLRPRGPTGTS